MPGEEIISSDLDHDDSFHVYGDVSFKEALFVTEKTLSNALDQLDVNTHPLNNNDKMPDLEVTQMTDDHLTIQLSNGKEKSGRNKKFSESSEDIEVVHSHSVPQLHGILKDRTVSESSEEAWSQQGSQRSGYRREDSVSSMLSTGGSASEGIVSESEGKKSVSFSEHVDQTTYKSNSSVTTLHASLKKKNKRFRKKEAKIERRRRKSSGSEHEHSSEEQSSQHESTSEVDVHDDANDVIDDDVIFEQLPEPLPEEPRNVEEEDDEVTSLANAPASKKSKKNRRKNKNKCKSNKDVPSETNAASHAPRETRNSEVSEEGESATETVSPTDGERTNAQVIGGDSVNGVGDNSGNSGSKSSISANGGDTADVEYDSDDNDSPFPPKKTEKTVENEVDIKDAPDTVLSWREGQTDASDVTKCAFKFSNAMMYELDED